MTLQQAEDIWEKKRINVFDLTHVWPQGEFPLRTVGKLTLDENAKVSRYTVLPFMAPTSAPLLDTSGPPSQLIHGAWCSY